MTPRPYSPAGADGNAGIAPVPGLPPDVGVDLLAGADAGIAPVPDADAGIAPVPGAGPHSLLVDSGEFYAAIAPAILAARRRVYIQVMTFELDTVGARLWQLLARSPAACKILCVDAFSRIKISDRPAFGWRYWTSPSYRAEARRTRRLLRPGVRDGVRIVITNPLGAGWHKYPHRNHKKMMIVDDAAFLGGINFSDHNFAWHDLMLRTTDPTLVSALAADFQITITGRSQNAIIPTPAAAAVPGAPARSDATRRPTTSTATSLRPSAPPAPAGSDATRRTTAKANQNATLQTPDAIRRTAAGRSQDAVIHTPDDARRTAAGRSQDAVIHTPDDARRTTAGTNQDAVIHTPNAPHRTTAKANQNAVLHTPNANRNATIQASDDARLYLLNGRHSRPAYERLFAEITSARASVTVLSPYLTNPLLSRLRALPPSVRVRIITPERNNKPLLRRALLSAAAGSALEILLYQPRMSHLKAILVDDTRLILGSYNFDFVGSELQQEVVLSTADPTLIQDFQTRILQPALSHSRPVPTPPRPRPYAAAPLLLRAAETIIRKIPPP